MNSLLIMAGGASSRMKKSLENSSLSSDQKEVAQRVHKSLIPLGKTQKPLLFHLISNAVAAGYTDVYLITSPENEAFQQWVGNARSNNSLLAQKYISPYNTSAKEGKNPLEQQTLWNKPWNNTLLCSTKPLQFATVTIYIPQPHSSNYSKTGKPPMR